MTCSCYVVVEEAPSGVVGVVFARGGTGLFRVYEWPLLLLLVLPLLSLERFVGVFDASMLDIFRKNSVHESPGVPMLLILEVSGSDGSYLY